MEEIKKRRPVPVSMVREILGKGDPDDMDQIQRWTLDYVSKFSRIDGSSAMEIKRRLVDECGLTEEEAVEIINILPTTIAELRSFTFGWKKLILAETLEKILKILKEHA